MTSCDKDPGGMSLEEENRLDRERLVDCFNWRGRVSMALGAEMDLSCGRAVEIICGLREALRPFANAAGLPWVTDERETMHIPVKWLKDAERAIEVTR